MASLPRRQFLAAAGAATALPAFAKFSHPVNLQLYTLRDLLPKQPRATLERVAKIGYDSVEPGRGQLAELLPYIKEFRLTTPSVHLETPLATGNWEVYGDLKASLPAGYGLEQALEEVKRVNTKILVVSYLMPTERNKGGLDFYRRFADQMNRSGEKAWKQGIRLCYHHHSFEFEPMEGSRPWDVLVERLDPKLVHFQVDVFWMTIGGNNAAAMLRSLKGRVAAVHLKDIAPATPVSYNEGKVAKGAFLEVGSGALNWKEVLAACREAGVEHYIVEQDQCAGSPLDSIEKSYRFLQTQG